MFGFGLSNVHLRDVETELKKSRLDEVSRRNIQYKMEELDRMIKRSEQMKRLDADCRNLIALIKKSDKNAAIFLAEQMKESQEAYSRSAA